MHVDFSKRFFQYNFGSIGFGYIGIRQKKFLGCCYGACVRKSLFGDFFGLTSKVNFYSFIWIFGSQIISESKISCSKWLDHMLACVQKIFLSDFNENLFLGQFGHVDSESGLSLSIRVLGGAREQKWYKIDLYKD